LSLIDHLANKTWSLPPLTSVFSVMSEYLCHP
jgi:hypothetical protein